MMRRYPTSTRLDLMNHLPAWASSYIINDARYSSYKQDKSRAVFIICLAELVKTYTDLAFTLRRVAVNRAFTPDIDRKATTFERVSTPLGSAYPDTFTTSPFRGVKPTFIKHEAQRLGYRPVSIMKRAAEAQGYAPNLYQDDRQEAKIVITGWTTVIVEGKEKLQPILAKKQVSKSGEVELIPVPVNTCILTSDVEPELKTGYINIKEGQKKSRIKSNSERYYRQGNAVSVKHNGNTLERSRKITGQAFNHNIYSIENRGGNYITVGVPDKKRHAGIFIQCLIGLIDYHQNPVKRMVYIKEHKAETYTDTANDRARRFRKMHS